MQHWQSHRIDALIPKPSWHDNEVTPWVLYTRHIFPAGMLPEHMKCVKQLSVENTIRDTNLHWKEAFPVYFDFLITSVHVIPTGSDRSREFFRHNYIFELQVGCKIYYQVPVELIDALGVALAEAPEGDPKKLAELARTMRKGDGLQTNPGYFPEDFPIHIPAGCTYKPQLSGTPFLVDQNGFSILVALCGLIVRQIQ